jgi:hypothetical protein
MIVPSSLPPMSKFLHRDSQGKFYSYGRPCECGSGSLSSYCAVQDYLGLTWVEKEKTFGCSEHRTLVLFSDIPQHLGQKHLRATGTRLKRLGISLNDTLDHLAFFSPVNRLQTLADLNVRDERQDKIDILPPGAIGAMSFMFRMV